MKKATPQSQEKRLMEIENTKEKLWFMILTTRYESNPEAIVWNGSEKFMSVKIHVLEKTSVAKLFKHIDNKN